MAKEDTKMNTLSRGWDCVFHYRALRALRALNMKEADMTKLEGKLQHSHDTMVHRIRVKEREYQTKMIVSGTIFSAAFLLFTFVCYLMR